MGSDVVADRLTRVRWIEGIWHSDFKRHLFHHDSIERIFHWWGEDLLDVEYEGYVEKEDEINDNLEDKDLTERFEISPYIIIQLWDILESATL